MATAPRTETRSIVALVDPEATVLRQFDLPSGDGVVGDLAVSLSSGLLDSLGDPGAVRVEVTVTPVARPSEEQRRDRLDVVG